MKPEKASVKVNFETQFYIKKPVFEEYTLHSCRLFVIYGGVCDYIIVIT